MVEGAASLMAPFFGLVASGTHDRPRGENTLDSGAPFYEVYECADGRWLSLAPIERRFRREMVRLIGLDPSAPDGEDPADWPELKRLIAASIATRPLAERCANRSEEHTSELQSLMRSSYAVFCLQKKQNQVYQAYYV